MQIWFSHISPTWKLCSEDPTLIYEPGKVIYPQGISHMNEQNLKLQDKDIEDFAN